MIGINGGLKLRGQQKKAMKPPFSQSRPFPLREKCEGKETQYAFLPTVLANLSQSVWMNVLLSKY